MYDKNCGMCGWDAENNIIIIIKCVMSEESCNKKYLTC